VDRTGRKRGALGRESALPLTGRRAEAVLVLPLSWGVKSRKPERRERDRGRQRQVHDLRSRLITPGRGSAVRRALDHGPSGPSRLSSPGNRGTIVQTMLKLEARRQAKLHSIMLSAKVSAGRRVWKLSSR